MKTLSKAEIVTAEKGLLKHLPRSFQVVQILKKQIYNRIQMHDVTLTGLRLPSRY